MAGRPLSDDQKRERIADLKAIADRKRAAVKAGKKAEKNKLLKELAEAGEWNTANIIISYSYESFVIFN